MNILPYLDFLGLPFIVSLKTNEDCSNLLKMKQKIVTYQYRIIKYAYYVICQGDY